MLSTDLNVFTHKNFGEKIRTLNDNLFISDDNDAKMYAEIFGINGRGTIYLLLKACKDGIVSKDECIKTFDEMIKEGFWISPEVINLFYEKIKKFLD
jgi:predicted nucleic acid-binding protein